MHGGFALGGFLGGGFAVVLAHDLARQPGLPGADLGAVLGCAGLPGIDLGKRQVGQERGVALALAVGQGVDLVVHDLGRFGDAHVVAQRLRHLLVAASAQQNGHEESHLGLLVRHPHDIAQRRVALQLASTQHVELLVGAAQLHVGLDHHGVQPLHERVEELVQRDGVASGVAVLEVLALQHLGHRDAAHQFGDLVEGK